MAYSEFWNIQKFDGIYIPVKQIVIFSWNGSRPYLLFAKRSSLDHFRCLAAFWIPLCIHICYVPCKVILGSVSRIFKHIWALFKSIFTIFQNLLYLWHIQNPDIFKSSTVFRTLSDILQCLWKIVPGYNCFCKELLLRSF